MNVPAVFQKTLGGTGRLSGTGLHTGRSCSVLFRPASPGSGIRFFRAGKFVADLKNTRPSQDPLRCSSVGQGEDRILTVEHLLACLSGMGITNLEVEVEGPELPGLDGSALPFAALFQKLGVVGQSVPADIYRIEEPIVCYDKLKSVAVYPADAFSVSYVLDYEHPYLKDQKVDFSMSPETFLSEIAPARTFCTEKEAGELPKLGLGLGANPDNTLVVREDGSHRSGMRFADECARHKVLDILGDLMLLGFPVVGRVVGLRSGHALNQKLVEAIRSQRGAGLAV